MELGKTFKCVPFDNGWAIAGTRYNLSAIYRRPRRTVGEFDQVTVATSPDGLPLWDLTTPLPVRRHADWAAKGYEYVTLADMESLEKAAPSLRAKGFDPKEYIQHPQLGPWNPKFWAATAEQGDRQAFRELLALVEQFGIEAVEQIRGSKLPEALKARLTTKDLKAPSPRKAAPLDAMTPDSLIGDNTTTNAANGNHAGTTVDTSAPASAPTRARAKPKKRPRAVPA